MNYVIKKQIGVRRFSVVSAYACDSCGCKHKARESINVYDVEGKNLHGVPVVTERSNDDKMRVGEVNEDVSELPVTVTPPG